MKSIYKLVYSIFTLCCFFATLSAQDTPSLALSLVTNTDDYKPVKSADGEWHIVGNGLNNFVFDPYCPPSDSSNGVQEGTDSALSADSTFTRTYVRYHYEESGYYLNESGILTLHQLTSSLNAINVKESASVCFEVTKIKESRTATFSKKIKDLVNGEPLETDPGSFAEVSREPKKSNVVKINIYQEPQLIARIDGNEWPTSAQNVWADTVISVSVQITGGYEKGNTHTITINGQACEEQNNTVSRTLSNSERSPKDYLIVVTAQANAPGNNNIVWGETLTKSLTYHVWSEPKLEKKPGDEGKYSMFQANQNGKCEHSLCPIYDERGSYQADFEWSSINALFSNSRSKDTKVSFDPIQQETSVSCTVTLKEIPVSGMSEKTCSQTYNLSIVPKPEVTPEYDGYPVFLDEPVEKSPKVTPIVNASESLNWTYVWSNGGSSNNIGTYIGTTLGEQPLTVTATCKLSENSNDAEQQFSDVKTFKYKVFKQPEVSLYCRQGRFVLADSTVVIEGRAELQKDANLTGTWSADDQGNNLCEFAHHLNSDQMESIKRDFDWTYTISYQEQIASKSGCLSHEMFVCKQPEYRLNSGTNNIVTCGGHPTDVGVKLIGGFDDGWNVKLLDENLVPIGNFQSEKITFDNENESGKVDKTYYIEAAFSVPYIDGRPDSAFWYEPKQDPITVTVYARPRLTNIEGVSRNDTIRQYYGMKRKINFDVVGGYGADGQWDYVWLQDSVFESCASTVDGINPDLGNDPKSGTIRTDEEGRRAHATKIRYAIIPLHYRGGEQFCHDTLWFNYEVYSKGDISSLKPENVHIYGSGEECRGKTYNNAKIDLRMVGGYDRGWTYTWTPLENEGVIVSPSERKDPNDGNHATYSFNSSNTTDSMKPVRVRVEASNSIPGLSAEEKGNTLCDTTVINVYPKALVNLLVREDNKIGAPDTLLFCNNAIESVRRVENEWYNGMSLDTCFLNRYYGDSIRVSALVSGGAEGAWYSFARIMDDTLQFDGIKTDSLYVYSLKGKAPSDSALMKRYQNYISLHNYGPSGDLWAEVNLPLTTQWWSEGTVTTDNGTRNLYGSKSQTSVARHDEITLSAITKGGYLPGYRFWWTYDENAKDYFVEKATEYVQSTDDYLSEQPIFNNYLRASNMGNKPQDCTVTLHWENKIDEKHAGKRDSITYRMSVYPRASLPEFIDSSDGYAQGPVNMRQIQTADGNASFAVTPSSGGGKWNYQWSFDDLPLDQDTSTVTVSVSNQFPGIDNMSKKVVPVKLIWNNTNPADPTEIWESGYLPPFMTCIYNSPKRPDKLRQKGSGASNIYIADMGEMSDDYWMTNEYIFEFGDGNSLAEREVVQRWHQYSSRPSSPWVRTLWEYPAHGDGLFPEFTASFGRVDADGNITRTETGIHSVYEDSALSGNYIYTLDGRLLRFYGDGDEMNLDLPVGIYILENRSGANRECKKIMIK